MAKPELITALHRITEPVAISMGLCLWGIELIQGGRPVVRIYVDTPPKKELPETPLRGESDENADFSTLHADEKTPQKSAKILSDMSQEVRMASASVEQCAELSRVVGLAMEVEDIFATAYVLEVSSPGFSRPFFHLWQMAPYVGDIIEASLMDFLPNCPDFLKGRKKFTGELLRVGEEDFTLRIMRGAEAHDLCIAFSEVRKASRVHIFVAPEKPGKKRKEK